MAQDRMKSEIKDTARQLKEERILSQMERGDDQIHSLSCNIV